jgi:hypothetical protein
MLRIRGKRWRRPNLMVGRCWSLGQVAGRRVLDPFSATALAGGVVPGLLLGGRGEILARSFFCGCGRAAADPGCGGRRGHARLPARQPGGRRVSGGGGERRGRGVARDRGPSAEPRGARPRVRRGSGLDLLDRVRAADGLASRLDPDLPVVVLTGRAGEADRVRSFARGADDHLSKPTCRFPQREIPLPGAGCRSPRRSQPRS